MQKWGFRILLFYMCIAVGHDCICGSGVGPILIAIYMGGDEGEKGKW